MSENEKPKTIDYFVHEGVMTQMSMAMDRVQSFPELCLGL